MGKIQALIVLRDKVQAGDVGYNGFLDIAELALKRADVFSIDAWKAYNGSLDAAKALHEAVLPGWDYGLYTRRTTCDVAVTVTPPGFQGPYIWINSHIPARAWLLAILEALIVKANAHHKVQVIAGLGLETYND